MGSPGNCGLKKRAFHCHLNRFAGLIVALALSDSDMGDSLILHYRLDIRKVKIDYRGNVNQIRDSLHRLLKHLVGFL